MLILRPIYQVYRNPIEFLHYLYFRFVGKYSLQVQGAEMNVNISNRLGDYRQVMFFERNEHNLMNEIIAECDEKTTYLDVGANIGLSSILVAGMVKQVYSIEPHPVNCSHLLKNLEINDADIDVYQCALSDKFGFHRLGGSRGGFLADGSAALVSEDITIPNKTGPSKKIMKLNVHVQKGDHLVNTEFNTVPDIIKIDVEGAEMKAIDGLSNTLSNPRCSVVITEHHEKGHYELNDLISTLESFGFRVDRKGRFIKGKKTANAHKSS